MPSSTFTAFSSFMGDKKPGSTSKINVLKSPHEAAREKAMSDMDMFIKK